MKPLVLLLVLASSACVPAGVDEDPHGGAGARIVPSAAASGQPFTTTDGWTVTIDRIAIQLLFNATTGATAEQRATGTAGGNSAGGVYVLDASKEQDLVARALPAQRADLQLQLTDRTPGEPVFLTDPPEAHGVDSALDARFSQLADSADPDQGAGSFVGFGPSIIVAAHGVKGGRTVWFDLGVDAFGAPASSETDLQANALTSLTFEVHAEALFTNDSGVLAFGDFDAADRDRNGQISPRELRLYEVPACAKCTAAQKAEAEDKASLNALSVVLEARADHLFVLK